MSNEHDIKKSDNRFLNGVIKSLNVDRSEFIGQLSSSIIKNMQIHLSENGNQPMTYLGDTKCNLICNDYGFDGAINYKTENISNKLKELCPEGVNGYLDNVDGSTQDLSLIHI